MRLVDADNLKNILSEKIKTTTSYLTKRALRLFIDLLDTMPTIEAEPVKHGKWLEVEPESDIDFYCSLCETEISTNWDYQGSFDYCPECGAKMDL